MRLNFNVLWVDDQPGAVDAQIKAISKGMQDHGFDFRPTLCRSIDEVRATISDNVFTDEVDLILVDWDLGGQVQGQQAIAEIRDQVQYKDVVFYSANTASVQLRELAFKADLEGIYCVSRTDLVGEVIGVFESLIKKVLDLDHVRGIVMGATSDIDAMILECLTNMHQRSDTSGQQGMLQEALGRIDEKLKELGEIAEKLRSANTFEEVLAAHEIFTANDRLRMLSRVLEQESFKAHHGYRPSVVAYLQKVVPSRNRLGHKVLVPEGKPQNTGEEAKQEIGLEDMRLLRRLLLDLRTDFRALLSALRSSA